MQESFIIIILVLYLLLVIVLQDAFQHTKTYSNPNPITIVGNVGPTTYQNGTMNIQYIGNPYAPFNIP